MPEPLVEVTRGDLIESVHRGHIAVADENGAILYHLGDPSFNLCLRSCAKPLQALPIIATGVADRYHLTAAELAVMCGSLNGQDFQVAAIRSILLQTKLHRPPITRDLIARSRYFELFKGTLPAH